MIQPINDHVDQAKKRAVWQYKGKANWDALTEVHAERMQVFEGILEQLLKERSLTNSVGVQLDRYGADYNIFREGQSDDDFRAIINSGINLLRSSGQVNSLLVNLQRLVGERLLAGKRRVALHQVFPLTVLMWVFVDDFGEISTDKLNKGNLIMQSVKAAGVRLEIGLQLNGSTFKGFIVAPSSSGGADEEGVATLPDGSDGGAFVKSIV